MTPLRADENATEAAPFFAPCQHAAWTYVNDGAADAWGACQNGQIVCCAGTACPANPKQPGDNNGTAPPPPTSGKENDVGVVASSRSSSAAARAGTATGLPDLPSLSLPALPVSFSRPNVASLSLPVTFNPSTLFPAAVAIPTGVSGPAVLRPVPTTASRT